MRSRVLESIYISSDRGTTNNECFLEKRNFTGGVVWYKPFNFYIAAHGLVVAKEDTFLLGGANFGSVTTEAALIKFNSQHGAIESSYKYLSTLIYGVDISEDNLYGYIAAQDRLNTAPFILYKHDILGGKAVWGKTLITPAESIAY